MSANDWVTLGALIFTVGMLVGGFFCVAAGESHGPRRRYAHDAIGGLMIFYGLFGLVLRLPPWSWVL